MAGTANTSLTLTYLEGVVIEFPELAVQREIVAELDAMQVETTQISANSEIVTEETRELVLDAFHSLL
jgi:restriction endonuclease S subunit